MNCFSSFMHQYRNKCIEHSKSTECSFVESLSRRSREGVSAAFRFWPWVPRTMRGVRAATFKRRKSFLFVGWPWYSSDDGSTCGFRKPMGYTSLYLGCIYPTPVHTGKYRFFSRDSLLGHTGWGVHPTYITLLGNRSWKRHSRDQGLRPCQSQFTTLTNHYRCKKNVIHIIAEKFPNNLAQNKKYLQWICSSLNCSSMTSTKGTAKNGLPHAWKLSRKKMVSHPGLTRATAKAPGSVDAWEYP